MTPAHLMLDTSAYSHFRAGHPGALDHIAEADVVLLPTIVLGELEAAFRLGRRFDANRQALAEFLDEPFTTVVAVDERVAHVYGRLFAELRAAGTPIPINDVWIAASAMVAAAHLLTFDGDFARVPGLSCSILQT